MTRDDQREHEMQRAQAILDAQHLKGTARILHDRGFEASAQWVIRLGNRILDGARPGIEEETGTPSSAPI